MSTSLRSLTGAFVIVATVAAQTGIAQSLQRVYNEYLEARTPPDIERFVALDRELRQLTSASSRLSTRTLRPEWRDIGLTDALFDMRYVVYSGKLLADAHKANPNSPFRSATLFATVFPDAGENRNHMPIVPAAEAYLREFPAGPFAVEASLTLARFYDDFFKLLQNRSTGRSVWYKETCFARYVTTEPIAAQLQAAQQTGLAYYDRAATLRPGDASIREARDALERGTTSGWFYCAD